MPRLNGCLAFILSLAFAIMSYAGISEYNLPTKIETLAFKNQHAAVSISLASEWFNTVKGQSVQLLPWAGNYYTNGNSGPVLNGGVFVGVDRWLNTLYESRIGAGIYSNIPATMKGNVWLFEEPSLNFLGYSYKTSSTRILVEGKLLRKVSEHFLPFLGYGLGVACNHLSRYQEYVPPAINTFISSAPFQTQTTTSFSYDLAAGLEYRIQEQSRISFAYQYNNMGKADLAPSSTQATQEAISIANLQSGQFRVQLSYIN